MDMLGMNIANMATQMSQSRIQQDIGVAVLSNALNTSAQMGDMLSDQLMSAPAISENSVRPYLGGNFDVAV
ncbi:MAG: YjfB family protein [Lachnospiraceae bacterium]|nr:YjfB family protein [Lachnospiraceae bacterium]